MKNYETTVQALNDLYSKGYTFDFTLYNDEDCLYCNNSNQTLKPEEFKIDKIFRIESNSDLDNEVIIYAISSLKHNIKGTLINAFGVYADAQYSKLIEKLQLQYSPKYKPIKRAKALQHLSREHHHTLLLCWKINAGVKKNIEPHRIYNYLNWFYENYLLPHFYVEEKYAFPLLNNEACYKAIMQHNIIKQTILNHKNDKETLIQIQELLKEHIRYEERFLFNEIQNNNTLEQLQILEKIHNNARFIDNENDPFWK